MKKFFPYISFVLFSIQVQAQKSYVKLRTSVTILGSTTGIVKGMGKAGYGPKGLQGFFRTIDYPQKIKHPALDIERGIYIAEKTSLSVLVGFENAGHVDGYSPHTGTHVTIKYAGYVLSPKINFQKRLTLLGLGPTFMVFHYKDFVNRTEITKNTKLFLGLSLTAETLFSDKRPLSIGVFGTLNLYGGSKTQIIAANAQTGAGYAAKISATDIQIGLLFRMAHE